MQFAQGNLRSHFTFRCWQSAHAGARCGFKAGRDEGNALIEPFAAFCAVVDGVADILAKVVSLIQSYGGT